MSDKSILADSTTEANQGIGGRTALASVAAIGSVLAASNCCLPILPFIVAAGFAGSSTFLSAARQYLLTASILFVAYGFYQSWRVRNASVGQIARA